MFIVEDDPSVRTAVERVMSLEGYRTEVSPNGGDALERIGALRPDVAVVDVMMPFIDGLEVCRRMRARGDRTPVLLLTARHEVGDRVAGLDAGADDYLVKPFGFRELLARIRAVSRRTGTRDGAQQDRDLITAGALQIDLRGRRVTVRDEELTLTPKEFDLLALLAREPGSVVDRQRILREVWNTTWYGGAKTIDVHVGALRRKLGDPAWIETVRGVGLRLDAQP